jgi:hypothetical protein
MHGMGDAKLLGPDVDELSQAGHRRTARVQARMVEDHMYSCLVEELQTLQCLKRSVEPRDHYRMAALALYHGPWSRELEISDSRISDHLMSRALPPRVLV